MADDPRDSARKGNMKADDPRPRDADVFVDFNDVEADGLIRASRRFVSPELNVATGTWLWAGDYEGNRCWSQVIDQSDRTITLRVQLDTFDAVVTADNPRSVS